MLSCSMPWNSWTVAITHNIITTRNSAIVNRSRVSSANEVTTSNKYVAFMDATNSLPPPPHEENFSCGKSRNTTPVSFQGLALTDPTRTAMWNSVLRPTSSSAVTERPRDAPCHWIFARLQSHANLRMISLSTCKFLLIFHCKSVSVLHCSSDWQTCYP